MIWNIEQLSLEIFMKTDIIYFRGDGQRGDLNCSKFFSHSFLKKSLVRPELILIFQRALNVAQKRYENWKWLSCHLAKTHYKAVLSLLPHVLNFLYKKQKFHPIYNVRFYTSHLFYKIKLRIFCVFYMTIKRINTLKETSFNQQ